jgi:hypothetical protein
MKYLEIVVNESKTVDGWGANNKCNNCISIYTFNILFGVMLIMCIV